MKGRGMIDPIDETHRRCLETRNWLRAQFVEAKLRAATWEPAPMPAGWR